MATSSVDHVTFRWNDHVSYLSKLLSFQRVEEHYCDATIITDDCFVIKAHQAVLATTSGYFQKVLDGISSDQHPIIVLTGANFRELNCVLDYIYQGVTRVDQDMMESVLDIADMLEIKGLSKIKRNPSVKKSISLPQSLPSTSEILQGFISATPSPHLQSNEPLLDSQSTQPFIMSGNMHQQYSQNDSSNNQLCHSPFLNINDHQNTNCLKERCEDNTYVDQTSGIDLSLSRGGQMEKGFGRESLMQVEDEEESEQDNHNTMDETEHITNNSMSESELSNLTEIELRGERCPNRKNDYDSASDDYVSTASLDFDYPNNQMLKSVKFHEPSISASDGGNEVSLQPFSEKQFIGGCTSKKGRIINHQKSKARVKRPLLAYQLFVRDVMSEQMNVLPKISPQMMLKHIAARWKKLPQEQKEDYKKREADLRVEHEQLHPSYVYSPYAASERRMQHRERKRQKSLMYFHPFHNSYGKWEK